MALSTLADMAFPTWRRMAVSDTTTFRSVGKPCSASSSLTLALLSITEFQWYELHRMHGTTG